MIKLRFCKKCGLEFNAVTKHRIIRKICFLCRPANKIFTKQECLDAGKLCDTRWEFQKTYPRHYKKSFKCGWLDEVCAHMPLPKTGYTIEDCINKAQLCKTTSEFYGKYRSHYNAALRSGWLKDVQENLEKCIMGFNRTSFIKACDRNSNGVGTLYLIKCSGNGELFYKIGITSQTLGMRYSHPKDMPYKWSEVWQIKGNPADIWNMESSFKRDIRDIIYLPKLWKSNQTTECFICNDDSAILKSP